MEAFLKANPSLNLLPGDESEETVYSTLGARLTVFDPVPLDMPKDVGATDLVKARRALRDATQVDPKIPMLRPCTAGFLHALNLNP